MFFIKSNNEIYSGDRENDDRKLTYQEEFLVERGYGYEIQEGKLVDISETQEYKNKNIQAKNQAEKENLRIQIDEIDKKRIRAICEPSLKDETTDQTWLEYYNLQVQELRNQIAELS